MSVSAPTFAAGARDVAPILFGIVPFGLVFGVAAAAVDLQPLQAVAMSMLVFVSVSQLAGAAILA